MSEVVEVENNLEIVNRKLKHKIESGCVIAKIFDIFNSGEWYKDFEIILKIENETIEEALNEIKDELIINGFFRDDEDFKYAFNNLSFASNQNGDFDALVLYKDEKDVVKAIVIEIGEFVKW